MNKDLILKRMAELREELQKNQQDLRDMDEIWADGETDEAIKSMPIDCWNLLRKRTLSSAKHEA